MMRCYLGLGSNLKNPQRLIRQAIQAIKTIPQSALICTADLCTTPPWGVLAQPSFCNTVVALDTRLPPLQLLAYCQRLENKFGRVRKKHWGPRTLDIDILLYGDLIIKSPTLTIPHPYINQRDFVWQPIQKIQAILADKKNN